MTISVTINGEAYEREVAGTARCCTSCARTSG